MKNNTTSKLLFRLLPIQILLAAIGSINGIVSSLFASNSVGVDAMSAVGLYYPFNQFTTAVCVLFVSGSSIMCGKYLGRNQQDKVKNVFSLSIILGVLLSALITLFLLFPGIFDLSGFLTKDPSLKPLLDQYMIGQAIGIPAFILGGLLSSFLSLENKGSVHSLERMQDERWISLSKTRKSSAKNGSRSAPPS